MEKKFLDIKGEEGWTGVYIVIFVKKNVFRAEKCIFRSDRISSVQYVSKLAIKLENC